VNLEVPVLVLSFVLFLILNVPISISIALSTLITVWTAGGLPALIIVAQRMANGLDSFALLAIPFFILSGMFMGRGGIARRLIDFAYVIVGRLPGGLAYVNVLTCMIFGAISGSAVAAVSSVGGFMIPVMNREGYDRDFNAAVSITAATTGLVIPPSNIMIVYSVAAGGVSIAAIFLAGFLPGILIGLGLMAVSGIISRREGYGSVGGVGLWESILRFKRAFLSLLLIVIVLGGILAGFFTATEASAIAVLYSMFLSVAVYKEVKVREIPRILLDCGITTAVVMLLIAASTAMSWILAYENIPQMISQALIGFTHSKILILLIINIILLAVGTFMDMTPAVLIFTPIFLPVAKSLGMNPIHFGIMMIVNLCIGLCTPPVGSCLFVGCGIAHTTIAKVIKPLIPFFIAMIVSLLLITYIPAISLALPRLFGFN